MSSATPSAVVLIPLTITDDMLVAGTSVPVVDTSRGEVAWTAGSHANGAANVNCDGSLWTAIAEPGNARPGTDATKWRRSGPSNRAAAFSEQDADLLEKTRANAELKLVIKPGQFFTGVMLWGLEGDHLDVTIYDEPGGEPVEHYSGELYEQALGLYELLFYPLRQRTKHYMRNLPLYPDAQVHITITASGNGPCAVGLVSIGHWDTLLGSGDWGGVQYGAKADVKTYSSMVRGSDGKARRIRRGSSTDVTCQVVIEAEQANHAVELLHQVQGRVVAFVASGLPRYDYLSGLGDLSGSATPESFMHAVLSINFQGVVQ